MSAVDRRRYYNKYDRRMRMQALTHYGGPTPSCACCPENRIEFLSIDHIEQGGRQHILSIGKGQIRGNALYKWLYNNDYPAGFRVLCHNCNFALGHYGHCPHEDPKIIAERKKQQLDDVLASTMRLV